MRRINALKILLNSIKDNDICIFSGNNLNKQAYDIADREGNLYIVDSDGSALSIGLGIAMTSTKRVFIFCGDGDLFREYNVMPQAATSRCKNLFYIVLNNKCYQSAGKSPTIGSQIETLKGALVNLGFIVYNLTPQLSLKRELANVIKTIVGPMVIFLDIDDKDTNSLSNIPIDKVYSIATLSAFVQKNIGGSSLFEPPTF